MLVALQQIGLDTPIEHDVGIQFVDIQMIGIDLVFEVQAQAARAGVFAGIDLGEQ